MRSPSQPKSSSSNNMSTHVRQPRPELQMPLPRFHPAVYQSPNSSNVPSPTRTRPPGYRPSPVLSPQAQQRQITVAQQKLQQYQRDILVNASRAAANLSSSAPRCDAPKAPSLLPRGSPGPATPLMLEEGSDYLSAGMQNCSSQASSSSSIGSSAGARR